MDSFIEFETPRYYGLRCVSSKMLTDTKCWFIYLFTTLSILKLIALYSIGAQKNELHTTLTICHTNCYADLFMLERALDSAAILEGTQASRIGWFLYLFPRQHASTTCR